MILEGLKVAAIIEARMTSSRLPGKVIMPAAGTPLLQVLIERLQHVERLDDIIVATTTNDTDDPIVDLVNQLDGIKVHRGSEHDVLDRVCSGLKKYDVDICVEITGDCPLVDPELINEALEAFNQRYPDITYMSNSDPQRAVPAGFDIQIFKSEALYQLDSETQDPEDREHVSYGFYRPESNNRWEPVFIKHPTAADGTNLLVTLDYEEDYRLIRAIHEDLAPSNYGVRDVIDWISLHPEPHQACIDARQADAT